MRRAHSWARPDGAVSGRNPIGIGHTNFDPVVEMNCCSVDHGSTAVENGS